MSQTRKHSALESAANMVVGLIVNIELQRVIWPGTPLTFNLLAAAIFSIASMVRQYTMRRAFNWWGKV